MERVGMPLGDIAWILAIVGIAYVAFLLFVFFTQSSLLYFPNVPSRGLTATPDLVGLPYDEAEIVTDDGVRLHGWFVPAPAARATLLFFHGNAGNISHRLDSLRIFRELSLTVLIVDYRGYGRSEGTPSENGTYRDAEAAWRYLTEERGVAPAEIIYFGRSLGAAVAAHLATRHTPRALIMESAFTSVPDLAADVYPLLPARWLSRFHYNAKEYLGSVACPVLIIHGREDEIIPFKHGQALFAAAAQPKQFLEIQGGHNDGFLVSGRAYRMGLEGFLDAHFH
jgi:fermentation-respiration switch protein FrsA (DUF1100 family)